MATVNVGKKVLLLKKFFLGEKLSLSFLVKNSRYYTSSVGTPAVEATNNNRESSFGQTGSSSSKPQQVWENDLTNALPYSEVPHQKGPLMLLTVISNIRAKGRIQELARTKFKKFGPIYKEVMPGNHHFVHTCDKEAIERLHRLEGKYPLRMIMEPWKKWRQKNGLALGILISEGPEWKRMRTLLDKQMLRPKQVETYAEDMNEVITDFIERLRRVRLSDSSVEKMDKELFNWSLESIGRVLYEKRFNAFSSNQEKEFELFIVAVNQMFRSTAKLAHMPEFMMKTIGKKWVTIHHDAWDVIFTTGKKFIDEKLELIKKKTDNNEEVSGFLSNVFAKQNMSLEEIYGNVSELMAAAVDTTSNTMQWCLYELSRNPQYQDLLLEEQKSVLGDRGIATYSDLQKMPLLKAVIKEVLRLYPIAGFITRTLREDFNLCGYRIPKGTHILGNTFHLGRHPDNYDDPETFKPERWLRSDGHNVHSFAWLPFGHGPRMCIGKRVAELELHLLLARLTREFVIERGTDEDQQIVQIGLLLPGKPVAVKLRDRQN